MPDRRLLVDVSTLARWTGTPTGITRVEHALATVGHDRPATVLTIVDRAAGRFHAIAPAWQQTVLGWTGLVETPAPPRHGWRALIPGRQPLLTWLERRRLLATTPATARLAATAQHALLALRPHGSPLHTAAGHRIDRVPPDLAFAQDLAPGHNDIVFSSAAAWATVDIERLATLKAQAGFRYATLCHDLMQVTHPQWFPPEDVARALTYWRANFAIADLVVTTTRTVEQDIHDWTTAHGITPPPTLVAPLGYDPPPPATAPLPPGLEPGKFILFVSTIEPRKGHAMLMDVWRILLSEDLPQRTGMRLVCVGRPGWMVDDVLRRLHDPAWAGTLLHLPAVDGPTLDALYEHAAFCVYPSAYEGFGLPIIEAFARHKPVLASNGGALPETVAGRSPCLPVGDVDFWTGALAEWIEHPDARAPWETRLRDSFTHPTSAAAAAAMLDAVAAHPALHPRASIPA